MAPVSKPVGSKKPRGSVLFYDGEKDRGKTKPRRAKDEIVGNTDARNGGIHRYAQLSLTQNDKAGAKSHSESVIQESTQQSTSSAGSHVLAGFSSTLATSRSNAPHKIFSEPNPTIVQSDTITPSFSFPKSGMIPLSLRTSANAQVILNLTKDVLETFNEVPYVKFLVGVALKIIEISDEVKTYKERCSELVDKVLSFAQVVFEALLAFDCGKGTLDTSGIKGDLLQIQTVFESIYSMLVDLKNTGMRSRLRSVISRDEIASRISEQDRRLDNAIAIFQFKSMIKLRKYAETSSAGQNRTGTDSKDSHSWRKSFTYRPKPQENFIGRNSEIQVISTYLQHCSQTKSPARLCILGPGGIGKTSLALTIFHHDITTKFQQDRYFISCEATPSADLLLAELAIIFTISMEGDILKTLLLHLQNNPCLLVLDNFETVWDPPSGRSQVESLLTEITSIDTITLIITMRGSQKPLGTRWSEVLPPLKPIDVDSAMAIFKAISQKSDDDARNLVKAVNCIPLAVTLLATLASVDGESTEALWFRWQKESTSMVQQGGGRTNNLEKSIELSISSPRMQSDPGALVFLSVLSMLPDGMSPETIKMCDDYFPDNVMVYKAISTLRQNALIYEDSAKNIRVLNPIRLFIRNQHPGPKKTQAFLLGYFISLALQGTFYTDHVVRSRLEKETGNINAILLNALDSATPQDLTEIVQATINFSHYAYVSGKASVQAISRAIDMLETSNLPDINNLNLTEERTATKQAVRRGLGGRLYVPISYFVKSRMEVSVNEQRKEVDSALKLRADCLGCLGQVLSQQSKFSLAEEKFRQARKLHVCAGDMGGYAYDTLNLGLILSQSEKSSEDALELFKQAIALHEKVNDLPGKAYDLLAAGGTLRELYRFTESEIMFSDAASLFLDLKDAAGQATAYNGLGTVMLSRSRLREAEKYLGDSAILSADVGDIVGQAESVSGLAIVSLLLSRLPEAQAHIECAISLRDPSEDPDYLHILGRIYIGKEAWEQATAILSRALAIHGDIGDFRGEADDLCYLADIQYNQGNYRVTQDLACRALGKNPGKATTAQIKALFASILIHSALIHVARRELGWALAVYEEINDIMGQAHTFYLTAIYYIRLGDFEEASINLKRAFELHTKVGHQKGQADALSLIACILSFQNLLPQATDTVEQAMRIQNDIGNKSGQGNGLFVQALILLLQCRYSEAYNSINDALKLHEASHSMYGKARDLALLSNILWGQQSGRLVKTKKPSNEKEDDEGDSDMIANPLSSLEEGIGLFKRLGCFREMDRCNEQKRRMEMPSQDTDWKLDIII